MNMLLCRSSTNSLAFCSMLMLAFPAVNFSWSGRLSLNCQCFFCHNISIINRQVLVAIPPIGASSDFRYADVHSEFQQLFLSSAHCHLYSAHFKGKGNFLYFMSKIYKKRVLCMIWLDISNMYIAISYCFLQDSHRNIETRNTLNFSKSFSRWGKWLHLVGGKKRETPSFVLKFSQMCQNPEFCIL